MTERNPIVNVTVGGTTYLAGEPLPDGVADQIYNPKAWGESVEDESPKPAAKKAAAKRSASK